MTVAVTVAANRLSSHAILMTDEPPISLYDQILKELFYELEASETFPPQYVDQLKRLARSIANTIGLKLPPHRVK